MADTYPSADVVAVAIIAAAKITGADPFAIANGEVARGRIGTDVSRARAYAALALKEIDFGCGAQAIARMVGVQKQSVPNYLGSLEFSIRNKQIKWIDADALRDLISFIRLTAKCEPPAPAAKEKPKNGAVVVVKKQERGRVFSLHGIKVDFTRDSETIFYAGKEHAVSPRQAQLFEALAKGMPNPIGRDFLRHLLFGPGGGMTQKDVQLDLVVSDARHAAKALGLKIDELKGIGYSLVKP